MDSGKAFTSPTTALNPANSGITKLAAFSAVDVAPSVVFEIAVHTSPSFALKGFCCNVFFSPTASTISPNPPNACDAPFDTPSNEFQIVSGTT